VCWFHFTYANAVAPEGIPKYLGKYGWTGVDVFFVISGFIIPSSLYRSGYRLKNFPTFLLKRIIRLDPPYLVSIILVILVGYALTFAPHYEGEPFQVGAARLLLHLGYLNVLAGYEWLNPVYWTLAIEFQYYLLMGLSFPLVASPRRWQRLFFFVALGLLAWVVTFGGFIFHFIFLFFMGISLFQHRAGLTGRGELWLLLALFTCGALLTVGTAATLAGLAGVGGIIFLRLKNRFLFFLGSISYSLYLIHPPVAKVVFTLGRRFAVGDVERNLIVFVALFATIFAAYLLYLGVEKSAQKWSSAFKYRPATRLANAAGEPIVREQLLPLSGAVPLAVEPVED
jgi:peptidoglycan/LPS O-acetylase OafA/YrhL